MSSKRKQEEIIMDVDDSDENSDSDIDAEESAEERLLIQRTEQLETLLRSNNYQYDIHLELVQNYRKLGEWDSLKITYQRFQEAYPLTPQLWLKWISSEQDMASTPEQKIEILKLFEKATEDYLSIELWQEYIQHTIGILPLEETRKIVEKALKDGGLHAVDGHLLWETMREIELVHLSLKEEGSDEWKEQLLKVFDTFKRQLSVTLLDMESTYNEFKVWLESLPSNHGIDEKSLKNINWGYQKALEKLPVYKSFEDRLLLGQEDAYKVFQEYITATKDTPLYNLVLFERAILQFCLNGDLWMDYCMFALKLGGLAERVSLRAVRNVPWDEKLWMIRLKCLELENKSLEDIMSCFELGLQSVQPSSGIQLWLAYLEYNIRNCDDVEKILKLFEHANSSLNFNGGALQIAKLQTNYLIRKAKVDEARKILESYVSAPATEYYYVWNELIQFEKQHGTSQQVRKLFNKALNAVKDWPGLLYDEYLGFERANGTLNDIIHCMQNIYKIQKSNKKCLNNTYYAKTAFIAKFSDLSPEEQKMFEGRFESNTTSEASSSRKRSAEQDKEQRGNKRVKVERKEETNGTSISKKHPDRIFGAPTDLDHERTIFLSNLQGEIIEEDIKEMFPNCVKIQLAVDRKGISRRYAYVRFITPQEVEDNLKRDRELLKDRPVFISRCKPDRNQRDHAFRYATTEEKNKLFVKNLPRYISSEEFDDIFKPYGCSSTRLVKHKNGMAKGVGFVEFPNEESAKRALESTNGVKVKDREIIVQISAPPPRKFAMEPFESEEPTRHARTKLQTTLIPRNVQLKTKQEGGEVASTSTESTKPTQKSNADFRNMFLNK